MFLPHNTEIQEGRPEYYSDVHDCEEPYFISLREIVLARKQPHKMFVQHNTEIQEGRPLGLSLDYSDVHGCEKI